MKFLISFFFLISIVSSVTTHVHAAKIIKVKKNKKRELISSKKSSVDKSAAFYLSCLHAFNGAYTKVSLQKGNRGQDTELKKSLNDLYKTYQIQHVRKRSGDFSFTKGIKPNTVKFLTANGEYVCNTDDESYKEIKRYSLVQIFGKNYQNKSIYDPPFRGTSRGLTSCKKIEKTSIWHKASLEYTQRIYEAYLIDEKVNDHYSYYADFAKTACIKKSNYKVGDTKLSAHINERFNVKNRIEPVADLRSETDDPVYNRLQVVPTGVRATGYFENLNINRAGSIE